MKNNQDISPLQRNGARIFNIDGLAKAMKTSREVVELLIIMKGFPYIEIEGRKKPMFVECKVVEFLENKTRYKVKG